MIEFYKRKPRSSNISRTNGTDGTDELDDLISAALNPYPLHEQRSSRIKRAVAA